MISVEFTSIECLTSPSNEIICLRHSLACFRSNTTKCDKNNYKFKFMDI